MLRRTSSLSVSYGRWSNSVTCLKSGAYTPAHFWLKWKKGLWPEDYSNDYDCQHYYHPKEMKDWYAKTEIRKAKLFLDETAKEQSANHNAGLNFDGDGPFERELKRKGIQVDKYPLPSTTWVMRMHEMTYLRRKKIEEQSKKLMADEKERVTAEYPSQWYDETEGPLNPHFLHFAQPLYRESVIDLPREPIRYEQYVEPFVNRA